MIHSSCLFLDRDGVVNVDTGYPYRTSDFKPVPNIVDLITSAKAMDYLVVVISNQSGIARGLFTHSDVIAFHEHINTYLQNSGSPPIDLFLFCPHHPNGSVEHFSIDCDCRKPKVGLIRRACEIFRIDLSSSLLVGDSIRDCAAGLNAGIPINLLLGPQFRPSADDKWIAIESLRDAICYL
jgi:D-glycero-D-manno-heptose 1,7-bisphosphate phosphatase